MKFQCRYCRRTVGVESDKEAPHAPFCSERCKMAELNNWFSDAYRISRPLDQSSEEVGEPEGGG